MGKGYYMLKGLARLSNVLYGYLFLCYSPFCRGCI